MAAFIVSSFTFISPVSSSMVAPATDIIAQEFHITSTVLIAMTTSIFVLAYGIIFMCPNFPLTKHLFVKPLVHFFSAL